MFGLLHLGTVGATSCCEQNPSRKQLRRGVDLGDCFEGIQATMMGKAWWLHSGSRVAGMGRGNSSPSSVSIGWRQGLGLEVRLSHDPQDPSPGSTTSQSGIIVWRPSVQAHVSWKHFPARPLAGTFCIKSCSLNHGISACLYVHCIHKLSTEGTEKHFTPRTRVTGSCQLSKVDAGN